MIVKYLRIVGSCNQNSVECCYQYHPHSIPHTAHSSQLFQIFVTWRQAVENMISHTEKWKSRSYSWLAGSEWRDKNSNKFTFTNNTTIVIEIMCGTFLVLCNFFLLLGIPRTVNFSCKKCHFILDKTDWIPIHVSYQRIEFQIKNKNKSTIKC